MEKTSGNFLCGEFVGMECVREKSPILCMGHEDVAKTLVLWLTLLTEHLARVMNGDRSTWLTSVISCLAK